MSGCECWGVLVYVCHAEWQSHISLSVKMHFVMENQVPLAIRSERGRARKKERERKRIKNR